MKGWFENLKKWWKLKHVDLNGELARIEEEMQKVDPNSETYKTLQEAQKRALENKALVKKMAFFGIPPEKIMFGLIIVCIAIYGFSLDLESPKSMRIASFVLNLVKKA